MIEYCLEIYSASWPELWWKQLIFAFNFLFQNETWLFKIPNERLEWSPIHHWKNASFTYSYRMSLKSWKRLVLESNLPYCLIISRYKHTDDVVNFVTVFRFQFSEPSYASPLWMCRSVMIKLLYTWLVASREIFNIWNNGLQISSNFKSLMAKIYWLIVALSYSFIALVFCTIASHFSILTDYFAAFELAGWKCVVQLIVNGRYWSIAKLRVRSDWLWATEERKVLVNSEMAYPSSDEKSPVCTCATFWNGAHRICASSSFFLVNEETWERCLAFIFAESPAMLVSDFLYSNFTTINDDAFAIRVPRLSSLCGRATQALNCAGQNPRILLRSTRVFSARILAPLEAHRS